LGFLRYFLCRVLSFITKKEENKLKLHKAKNQKDYFEIYRVTKNHLWIRKIEDIRDLILMPKGCGLNLKGEENGKY